MLRSTRSSRRISASLIVIAAALGLGLATAAVNVKSGTAFQFRRRAIAKAEAGSKPSVGCGGTLNVGFQIRTFSTGLRAAVWYPTTAPETPYSYPGRFESSVAFDGPVAACGQRYPLIVFSHGFDGCGIQSVFITEALARAGYIVAAPDHRDAACQVDQPVRIFKLLNRADAPTKQHDYSESSYRYRQQDVETTINELLRDQRMGTLIDANRIGGVGHSLGGYTMIGLAGAWPSWKDNRIKAILLLSPYLTPYLEKGSLKSIHIPVMYQGGTRDSHITPDVSKSGGAYEVTNGPKYYVEINGAGHLDWSNWVCSSHKYIPDCAAEVEKARLINSYGIAFLNKYLKGMPEPILDRPNSEVADLRHAN